MLLTDRAPCRITRLGAKLLKVLHDTICQPPVDGWTQRRRIRPGDIEFFQVGAPAAEIDIHAELPIACPHEHHTSIAGGVRAADVRRDREVELVVDNVMEESALAVDDAVSGEMVGRPLDHAHVPCQPGGIEGCPMDGLGFVVQFFFANDAGEFVGVHRREEVGGTAWDVIVNPDDVPRQIDPRFVVAGSRELDEGVYSVG